jgi:hypothetical protein
MGIIRKVYTAGELAKSLKKSRMWISMLWRQGRLPHDLEDQSGRPYWFKSPKIKLMEKGRRRAIKEPEPGSRKQNGK